jgi:hypothetical protein
LPVIKDQADWWYCFERDLPKIKQTFEKCGADIYAIHTITWGHIHEQSIAQMLDEALKNRNPEVACLLLQLCWSAAPDSPEIHHWPAWNTICDLCSENWVFDPDEVDA